VGTQQKRIARKVRVGVGYGMGGSAFGEFSRDEIAGKSVAEVIQGVVDRPQVPGSAARTAKVLADALRTTREIDAELTRASSGRAEGRPVGLDQVVIGHEDGGERDESVVIQETEEITIRLSESYRGGEARWQSGRYVGRG